MEYNVIIHVGMLKYDAKKNIKLVSELGYANLWLGDEKIISTNSMPWCQCLDVIYEYLMITAVSCHITFLNRSVKD